MRWSQHVLFVLIALLCGSAAPAAPGNPAPDGDLRKILRRRFEGKLLLLHVPSGFDVLQFDMHGAPTRAPTGQPWTTAGLIHADKVDLHDNQLMIDGRRVVVALDPERSTRKLVPITIERTVHIGITLPPSSTSAAAANEFLERILSTNEVLRKIENAWRADVDISKGFNMSRLPADGKIGMLDGDRAVYAWESGVVSKPKAVYKPGPSYPAKALLKKIAGTIRVRVVVNEKGFPEIFEIVEHLREGLDANALTAISQWRFEPGLRNGVAAASMVIVELKFHLASKKS